MPRCNENLKKLRKLANWTQGQLAGFAIVGIRTVQKAEAGEEVNQETVDALAEVLGCSADAITRVDQDLDAISEGPWTIYRYLQSFVQPHPLAYCHSSKDAHAAILAMRESFSEHLNRCEPAALCSTGQLGFQRLQQLGVRPYCDRYLRIWESNKDTLLFAVRGQKRVGVSVVLPVTDAAYERFRSGDCTFMDLDSSCICESSQNLIVDSGVEFGGVDRRAWYEVTDSLRFAVFFQIAWLSRNPVASDFRILSFGASQLNTQRLEANGFQQCGTMPVFGYPLLEFSGPPADEVPAGVNKEATAQFVGWFKRLLPTHAITSVKQQALRQSLRIYQRLLGANSVRKQRRSA